MTQIGKPLTISVLFSSALTMSLCSGNPTGVAIGAGADVDVLLQEKKNLHIYLKLFNQKT
jgi:hypothetical protein